MVAIMVVLLIIRIHLDMVALIKIIIMKIHLDMVATES